MRKIGRLKRIIAVLAFGIFGVSYADENIVEAPDSGLTIEAPEDDYEREADVVADTVMRDDNEQDTEGDSALGQDLSENLEDEDNEDIGDDGSWWKVW